MKKDDTVIGAMTDGERKCHPITVRHVEEVYKLMRKGVYSRDMINERIYYMLACLNSRIVSKDCRDRALRTISHLESQLAG